MSELSKFFIIRPIFAAVISVVIVIAGLVSVRTLPIAQYPEIAPPTVEVRCTYPGASAEVVAETVAAPDRTAGRRRRADALHVVAVYQRRHVRPHRHLRGRDEPRRCAGPGAEPRQPRLADLAA